jgi:excinuclease ABC subunit C
MPTTNPSKKRVDCLTRPFWTAEDSHRNLARRVPDEGRRGRVIYVGKAKNLRSRAGSYFPRQAALDRRTAELGPGDRDVDFIETDSEVDALLMEARLIKDIQPRFNQELKDDKTFPYLQITTREDFPRVEFTRKPRGRGAKLYGPFTKRQALRGADRRAAEDLQVPHLLAGHRRRRRALAVVPPVPAGTASTSAPPRATCGSARRVPPRHPPAADVPRRQEGPAAREMEKEMQQAGEGPEVREGARLRDEIAALENLEPPRRPRDARPAGGVLRRPEEGAGGLAEGAWPGSPAADDRGVDIAHLGGETVASWCSSSTACRSSRLRRYKIRSVGRGGRLRQHPRGGQPPLPPAARQEGRCSPTSC